MSTNKKTKANKTIESITHKQMIDLYGGYEGLALTIGLLIAGIYLIYQGNDRSDKDFIYVGIACLVGMLLHTAALAKSGGYRKFWAGLGIIQNILMNILRWIYIVNSLIGLS